jgi:hypothetical protein
MATTTDDLLWDEQGQIACTAHAPYAGSDTFVYGRWRAIRSDEADGFEREVGRQPACETCAAIARRGGAA